MEEIVIDYTTCANDAPQGSTPSPIPSSNYNHYFKTDTLPGEEPTWNRSAVHGVVRTYPPGGAKVNTTVCYLEYQIPDIIGPLVIFYYRLTNFYQNHRQYVKSLDSNQLLGVAESHSTI